MASFTTTLAVAACEDLDLSQCQSPAEVERKITEEFTKDFIERSKSSIHRLVQRCEQFEFLVRNTAAAPLRDPIVFNIATLRVLRTIADDLTVPTRIEDIGHIYRVTLSAVGRALRQFDMYYSAEEIRDRIREFHSLLVDYEAHFATMAHQIERAQDELADAILEEPGTEKCQRLEHKVSNLRKCHGPRASIHGALRRFVQSYERDAPVASRTGAGDV